MNCLSFVGGGGEAERAGFVLHDPARVHQRPGQHDVLADRIRPAADGAQVIGPVGRERALGDERAVVGRLHPLDAVDPEPVVPTLHPAEQVGRGVLNYERTGARADVLVLRAACNASDQIRERLRVQQGVRVHGHHQRRRHALKGRVERPVLAGRRFEHPPVVQAVSLRHLLRKLGGAVGRVVVGQDDLDRAGVGEPRDPVQRRPDAALFVPSRDDDGHRGPLPVRPRAGRRLRRRDAVAEGQQREGEKADQHPRDVGEQDRDDPRHHRADRFAKVRPPRRRDPDAERDVRDRESNRDHETDGRTSPAQRPRTPCQTAEPHLLGRNPLRHRRRIPPNPDRTRARTTLRELAARTSRRVQRLLRPERDHFEPVSRPPDSASAARIPTHYPAARCPSDFPADCPNRLSHGCPKRPHDDVSGHAGEAAFSCK